MHMAAIRRRLRAPGVTSQRHVTCKTLPVRYVGFRSLFLETLVRPAFLTCAAAFIAVAAATLSCDGRQPTAPLSNRPAPLFDLSGGRPSVVISQVYGGGGNSGATYKYDFIELLNTSDAAVDLTGWSVQYASAYGTSWQVTPLTGTLQPGAYYLVQEAKGAGGTTDLPVPNATGTIAMGAGAGKVSLAQITTALTGACPTVSVVDQVLFGPSGVSTTNQTCGYGFTPAPSNTNAAIRKGAGLTYTGNLASDFAVGVPTPRSSAVVGTPTVTVTPSTVTVSVGSTQTFTAVYKDATGNPVPNTTFVWTSSSTSVATISDAGVATAAALGSTTITATANALSATATMTVVPLEIHWLDVSSSSTSFPAGFQTQMFVTARTASGGTIIPANFTFESLRPDLATVALVANTGIVTGVAGSTTRPGIRITATALDGSSTYQFTTSSITIETPAPASNSIYATNDEFGDPTAASGTDPNDLLIVRPQYTLSYNESRGTPNWVSYELDARQTGGQDRCNCFTADPLLPADKQILTSDYTNGGYDRGHMAKSADRTAGNTDNAATFYLTNIVPQMADMNQGVWANFENALSDSAAHGRAVYIITGPQYSRSHGLTFLKNEGKVAVPDSTWKVAFIGPMGGGVPFARGDVQSWDALPGTTLLAVMMPNVAGVRNNPWSMYLTSVDRVEAMTGYDFLSLLPVAFQTAIEAGDRGPTAGFAVSGTPNEGSTLAFDASTSTDPDLGRTDMDHAEALSFAWTFGDGTSASGVAPTKVFGRNDTYTVTLTVTDAWGWPSVVTSTVSIANVAPQVAAFAGATILRGETYAVGGSFTDPGMDDWTATVIYGDGSGNRSLTLDGKTFQLSHAYVSAGAFTVGVTVNDGEVSGAAAATVTVLTPLQGITVLTDMVASLGASAGMRGASDGTLGNGEVNSLRAKLNAAAAACRRDNAQACGNILGAFVNEMQALVNSGRVSDGAAAPLIRYAERVIASLGA